MNRFLFREKAMLLILCLLGGAGLVLLLLFSGSRKPPDPEPVKLRAISPPAAVVRATASQAMDQLFHMPSLLDSNPVALPMGDKHQGEPFVIDEKVLSHHALILGITGTGKSRFAELIGRHLIDSLRGFCYIDPHSDTAENLLAYAMKKCEEEGTKDIVHQLNLIELSFETVFGFDPFRYDAPANLRPELQETAYRSWLDAKVDQFCEIVQINQGNADFQGMARLQRVLRDCVYAVGVALNDQGEHLPLSQIFAVLDCDHKYHEQVYDCVKDHLPVEIRSDIERWQHCTRDQRLRETESTLNRLRSLLSPLVQSIFSDPARSIPFRKVIDERGILLVSIRKSDFLSAAQRNAIASLFIHEIWSSVQTKDRELREDAIPYYLLIDEAPKFVGHDIGEILSEGRKFKLSVCLIGQHLSQFRRGEVDLIPDILDNCRSFFCFQQRNPEDLHILQEWFHYPAIDLTPLWHVVDRFDHYEKMTLLNRSHSTSKGSKWDLGLSYQQTKSNGTTNTHTESETEAEGRTEQVAKGQAQNSGDNTGLTIHRDAQGKEAGRTENKGGSHGGATNTSTSLAHNQVKTRGASDSVAHQSSHGESQGVKVGVGGNEAETHGEAETTQLVPVMREEKHHTGKLLHAISDQFFAVGKLISSLPNRCAIASVFGDPLWFTFTVGDVPNVFSNPKEMAEQLRLMKQMIYGLHEYYYTPELSPQVMEKRLSLFLARMKLMSGLEEGKKGLVQDYEDIEDAVREEIADGGEGYGN